MTRAPQLVRWHRTTTVRSAALILPGGLVSSKRPYWRGVDLVLRRLARRLASQGEANDLGVYLLRYRYLGWNGPDADTVVDAGWALDELERRHGEIPVSVIGNSLGAAAAIRVADHRRVSSVVALAPWLPGDDPVEGLAGRKVMIIHGDRDRRAAPARLSLAYAERARAVVPDLARFEVVRGRHALLVRSADCWAAITNFVLGTTGAVPLAPAILDAMAAPAPHGLRSALPFRFAA